LTFLAGLCPLGASPQSDFETCERRAADIKAGVTRGDVEQLMSRDGGIGVPFKRERYYFKGFPVSVTDEMPLSAVRQN